MPDILGTMEDAEGEASEKVARRQVARHGPDDETSASLEKLRYVLQLRYVVLPISAILLEQLEILIELFASMSSVQLAQLLEDNRPSFGLLVSVVDARNWVAMPIVERDLGEFLAPLPIDRIFEALRNFKCLRELVRACWSGSEKVASQNGVEYVPGDRRPARCRT